jgi:5-oxopent-3-ene-1,2,5-tricarboxylate decarboxylase/2-hydroxyhepta-2,4-diene-1,7-dioate isomerase
VPQLIADVTEFMTLSAGDILMIGVPAHRPAAKQGDSVKVEVEGIGSLENTVVAEARLAEGAV